MAYSSVRVQFEIGHEASVRTKKTPEGFTHDWEVFVRGADNTDIQCFVDKVVFHLHETFPKPRRVIKEPPYVVKESGYAGFVLPIDVYLKNKEEPKKISFQYDLTLQPHGPPISRVLREPRLFQNPSEDFRRKLIRGGGVGVDTPSEVQLGEDVKSGSAGSNKSKLSESPVKKHKPEPVQNDSFAELFGTPIRRGEPKKLPELPKKIPEVDAPKDKKQSKHGSYKNEKEIVKDKIKHSDKDRNKERDKSKEKMAKRPMTPPGVPQVTKTKEEHKKHEEKKKEDHEEKKKRKEEKEKREKSKDVKEVDTKAIEKEHKKDKKDPKDDYVKKTNSVKSHEVKPNGEKNSRESLEKERPEKEKHKHRHKKKEKEKNRDKEKHKKTKDKGEKESREREKEKSGKKRHEEPREKEEKAKRKSRSPSPLQVKKGPLNALLDELGSSGSGSPLSDDEEPVPAFKPTPPPKPPPAKIVPEAKSQPTAKINSKLKSTNLLDRPEKELEKPTKVEDVGVAKTKKEKSSSKKNKKSDKDLEKKRVKEEHRARSVSSEREDEDVEKERNKEEREPSEKEEEEKPKGKKDKENRKGKKEKSEENHAKAKKPTTLENNVMASQSAIMVELSDGSEEVSRAGDKFTKEYIAQLKDLQHRIMTLEDGDDLQNIVKVIAETGQYEITKKTFDFDLCALDMETVKRLQDFFNHT